MNLLNGRYAPITDAIGFVEADFRTVVAADSAWRDSLGGFSGHTATGGLPNLLDSLPPLTGPRLRYLWVQTTGPWTAYFDNFIGGSDPFGPVSYLAERLGCRGLAIGCREGTTDRGAAASFSLYGPTATDWLNVIRAVSAIQDAGQWEWSASGSPQPFEDLAAYQRRRVRDRLTPVMVNSYCAALGLRPFDQDFYGTKGWLVENVGVRVPVRTETLRQVRKSHGLN